MKILEILSQTARVVTVRQAHGRYRAMRTMGRWMADRLGIDRPVPAVSS